MKNPPKRLLAKKMMTKKERKSKVGVFDTDSWKTRKTAIKNRVAKKIVNIKKAIADKNKSDA